MATTAIPKSGPALRRNKLLAWAPTIIWLGMIAFFSTDTFSARHTASILERIIRFFYREISTWHFHILHVMVRKTAHFTVYGLLSLSAFYSWRATFPRRSRWVFSWSVLALVLTLVAASLDEFHQSFVPSRGPSVYDVMLDMMGAIFVQILLATLMATKASSTRLTKPIPAKL